LFHTCFSIDEQDHVRPFLIENKVSNWASDVISRGVKVDDSRVVRGGARKEVKEVILSGRNCLN
jgi:hypothetical protein